MGCLKVLSLFVTKFCALGEKIPLKRGQQKRIPPLRDPIGSSSVKTVANR